MRKISLNKRNEVIRLFFHGCPYDEIVERLGIAKGSIVNIIEEFRDGTLPLPPDLTSYVDELRKLAVDLKKHQVKVTELKSYLKLRTKLQEMNISEPQIEQWLDMCRYIAQPTVASEQFVQAALELARFTSENHLGYEDLVREYESKLKHLNEVKDEIEITETMLELKKRELNELRSLIWQHVERASRHLTEYCQTIRLHSRSRPCQSRQSCKHIEEFRHGTTFYH